MKLFRKLTASLLAIAVIATQTLVTASADDELTPLDADYDTSSQIEYAEERTDDTVDEEAGDDTEIDNEFDILNNEDIKQSIDEKTKYLQQNVGVQTISVDFTYEESEYLRAEYKKNIKALYGDNADIEKTVYAKSIYATDYFYNQMNAYEKSIYDALYDLCAGFEAGTIPLTDVIYIGDGVEFDNNKLTPEKATRIYKLFYYSNPQFYFLHNGVGTFSDGSGNIVGLIPYIIDIFNNKTTRNSYKNTINSITAEWLSAADDASTPLEKQKVIYTKLVNKIAYVSDGGELDQSIAGALVKGKCVCNGYALSNAYFLNALGIPCITVVSETHAWNIVNLHGNWYEEDVTWIDTSGNVDEWLNKSHTWFVAHATGANTGDHDYDMSYYTGFTLPSCTRDVVDTSGGDDPVPATVTKVTVKTKPTKLTYNVNDEFDPTGGVLTATLSDGTKKDVDMTDPAVTFTGTDFSTAGTKTVKATYESKYATFTVTVTSGGSTEATVKSVAVKTLPDKTEYGLNEEFDPTGGVLTATLSDGTKKDVDMAGGEVTFTGFSSTTAGTKTVKATYKTKYTTFKVTVKETTPIVTDKNVEVYLCTVTKSGDYQSIDYDYLDGFATISDASAYIDSLGDKKKTYAIALAASITENSIVLPKNAKEIILISDDECVLTTTDKTLTSETSLTFYNISIDSKNPISVTLKKANTELTIHTLSNVNFGTLKGTASITLNIMGKVKATDVKTFKSVNTYDVEYEYEQDAADIDAGVDSFTTSYSELIDTEKDVLGAETDVFDNDTVSFDGKLGLTGSTGGSMSGVATLAGHLYILGSDKTKNAVKITNIDNAFIGLYNIKKAFAPVTISNIKNNLWFAILDEDGNFISLESGTQILSAAANADFSDKIIIGNTDTNGGELVAKKDAKKILAVSKGGEATEENVLVTGSKTGFSATAASVSEAFALIDSQNKSTETYTVKLLNDISEDTLTFPTKAAGVILTGDNTLTITAKTPKLMPKTNFTVDAKIAVTSKTPLAISGTKKISLTVNKELTAGTVSSFNTVNVTEDALLVIDNSMTNITTTTGLIWFNGYKATNKATITNSVNTNFVLTLGKVSGRNSVANITITNIPKDTNTKFAVLDNKGDIVALEKGFVIAKTTKTGKILGNVTVANTDKDGNEFTVKQEDLNLVLSTGEEVIEPNVYVTDNKGYEATLTSLSKVFEAIESKNNKKASYEITILKDISEESLTFPKNAANISLSGEGTLTLTGKTYVLKPMTNFKFDGVTIKTSKDTAKKSNPITVTAAAKTNLVITQDANVNFGKISGASTSTLETWGNVTAANISTFKKVSPFGIEYEDGSQPTIQYGTLTVTGKMTSVNELDCAGGYVKFTTASTGNVAKNVTSGDVLLTQVKNKIATLTVTKINDELKITVVNDKGEAVVLEEGMIIAKAGSKTDISDKITIGNLDAEGHTFKVVQDEKKNLVLLCTNQFPDADVVVA